MAAKKDRVPDPPKKRPPPEPIGVMSFEQWHQWKRGEFDPWESCDKKEAI